MANIVIFTIGPIWFVGGYEDAVYGLIIVNRDIHSLILFFEISKYLSFSCCHVPLAVALSLFGQFFILIIQSLKFAHINLNIL